MNPVMMQQLSKADRYERNRRIEQIQLLNQAFPSGRSSGSGLAGPEGEPSALLGLAVRRFRGWVGGRQARARMADSHS